MCKNVTHIIVALTLLLSVSGSFTFINYGVANVMRHSNTLPQGSDKSLSSVFFDAIVNQDVIANAVEIDDNDDQVNNFTKTVSSQFNIKNHISSQLVSSQLHTYDMFYCHQLSIKQHDGFYLFSLCKILI